MNRSRQFTWRTFLITSQVTRRPSSSGVLINGATVKMLVTLIASASSKRCESYLPLKTANTTRLHMATKRWLRPIANAKNKRIFYNQGETPHSWADCPSSPANAEKKNEIIAGLRKRGRRKSAASSKLAQLENKFFATGVLARVFSEKSKADPSASSAIATTSSIVSPTS